MTGKRTYLTPGGGLRRRSAYFVEPLQISDGTWTAIAAALFGLNHPIGTFFASLFFGFADAFSVRIQNVTDLPPKAMTTLALLEAPTQANQGELI